MAAENDFSRLELSLPACRSNYRYFRSLLKPSTKLLVLVKANAYGHGAVEFASMMQAEGADYLAVALPLEAVSEVQFTVRRIWTLSLRCAMN